VAGEETEQVGYPHNTGLRDALAKSLELCRTPNPERARAVLMFSGGLDSVALLGSVLEHTQQDLHVHHIEIRNFENRHEAENRSIDEVMAFCEKAYRPFTYTSSVSEFNIGMGGGTDLMLSMFVAARLTVALGSQVDIVYTGHIISPFWELSEGAAVFNACFINRRFKPEWLTPLKHIDGAFADRKIDIFEAIPRELAEHTWSCRKPVKHGSDYQACDQCHACKARATLAATIADREGAAPGPDSP
jgi:hypothetical protein